MISDINKSLYNFSKSLLLALKGEFYLQETRIKVNIAGIPLQCTNNKNFKIIEHPPINRNCQRNMYSTSGFWTQIWDIWLRNLKYVHCDNCSSRDRLGYLCRDSDYFWDSACFIFIYSTNKYAVIYVYSIFKIFCSILLPPLRVYSLFFSSLSLSFYLYQYIYLPLYYSTSLSVYCTFLSGCPSVYPPF